MIHENIGIQVEGSTGETKLTTYIIDYSESFFVNERPLILICPGGGYEHVSDREGEVLALQFLAMGYHAVVLKYSVKPAIFPTALLELAASMKIIREKAEEWHIKRDKIFVLGCSAGAHLVATLGSFWNDDNLEIAKKICASKAEIKPNGMILCYPVITSGKFAHRGSFDSLLSGISDEKMLELVSLEKQVNADIPPVFIWHTYTDATVPVENSLMYVSALKEANIETEFHMYSVGVHGLSTANQISLSKKKTELQPECQNWIQMADIWIRNHV